MLRMVGHKILAAAGIVLAGLLLAGAITPKNLSQDLRTVEVVVVGYSAFDDTAQTAGTDGTVYAEVVDAATESGSGAEIGAMPYAGRLNLQMFDDAGDGDPACASVLIRGVSSRGFVVSETVSVVDDLGESLSVYSYESVTSIEASGCTGFAASDAIVVSVTDHVGLPVSINSNADILSVCKRDPATATNTWLCKKGSDMSVSRVGNSVDIGSGSLSPTDGDTIRIRARAPRRPQ